MGRGHTKASSCHTPSLDICFQPLQTILLLTRYFSITGFASHQKQHSSASSWSCVLNLKSSWQLNPTKATAAAVGNPSQHRGPCCWAEFPDTRSEWAMGLIGLWGTISTMTSPLHNCFEGEHLQGGLVIVCWELILEGTQLNGSINDGSIAGGLLSTISLDKPVHHLWIWIELNFRSYSGPIWSVASVPARKLSVWDRKCFSINFFVLGTPSCRHDHSVGVYHWLTIPWKLCTFWQLPCSVAPTSALSTSWLVLVSGPTLPAAWTSSSCLCAPLSRCSTWLDRQSHDQGKTPYFQ